MPEPDSPIRTHPNPIRPSSTAGSGASPPPELVPEPEPPLAPSYPKTRGQRAAAPDPETRRPGGPSENRPSRSPELAGADPVPAAGLAAQPASRSRGWRASGVPTAVVPEGKLRAASRPGTVPIRAPASARRRDAGHTRARDVTPPTARPWSRRPRCRRQHVNGHGGHQDKYDRRSRKEGHRERAPRRMLPDHSRARARARAHPVQCQRNSQPPARNSGGRGPSGRCAVSAARRHDVVLASAQAEMR